ncbi:hypothetical protein b0699 [Escherichia coli K-12]|nr:hypothetical protein b0699 [Escherichia coli K-12]
MHGLSFYAVLMRLQRAFWRCLSCFSGKTAPAFTATCIASGRKPAINRCGWIRPKRQLVIFIDC